MMISGRLPLVALISIPLAILVFSFGTSQASQVRAKIPSLVQEDSSLQSPSSNQALPPTGTVLTSSSTSQRVLNGVRNALQLASGTSEAIAFDGKPESAGGQPSHPSPAPQEAIARTMAAINTSPPPADTNQPAADSNPPENSAADSSTSEAATLGQSQTMTEPLQPSQSEGAGESTASHVSKASPAVHDAAATPAPSNGSQTLQNTTTVPPPAAATGKASAVLKDETANAAGPSAQTANSDLNKSAAGAPKTSRQVTAAIKRPFPGQVISDASHKNTSAQQPGEGNETPAKESSPRDPQPVAQETPAVPEPQPAAQESGDAPVKHPQEAGRQEKPSTATAAQPSLGRPSLKEEPSPAAGVVPSIQEGSPTAEAANSHDVITENPEQDNEAPNDSQPAATPAGIAGAKVDPAPFERTSIVKQKVLESLKQEIFTYEPKDMVDPFVSFITQPEPAPLQFAQGDEDYPELPPEQRRPLTPLQKMTLGEIERGLKAIMWGELGKRAVIEDSTGKGFIVTEGTPASDKNGVITEIFSDSIIIQQEIWDARNKRMQLLSSIIKLKKQM